MRLLLVGGAGHVGQLITPYLKPHHTLKVLDLLPPADPEIGHVQGSVLDPEAIRSALADVDAFVWLAMRSAQGGMVTDQDVETIVNNYDLNTKPAPVPVSGAAGRRDARYLHELDERPLPRPPELPGRG